MPSRKQTHNDLFNDLDKFMFTSENLNRFSNLTEVCNQSNESLNKSNFFNKSKEKTRKEPKIFYPRQYDRLFWCFYIIYKGEDMYHQHINCIFRTEKDMKIKTIELLGDNKQLLKDNKLKKNEIANELLNEKKITMNGLKALCLVYGVSVCVVKDRVYYDFDYSDDKSRSIIIYHDNYGVYNEDVSTFYTKITASYYQIINTSKPLNAITGYTINELHEICKKLDIPIINSTGVKLNKKDLYQSIQSQL